jgi:hypothetical protein
MPNRHHKEGPPPSPTRGVGATLEDRPGQHTVQFVPPDDSQDRQQLGRREQCQESGKQVPTM